VTAGEEWVRDLLHELRAQHYRSRGWLRLLAESFVRAHVNRVERRVEHRQTLALGITGLVAWIALGAFHLWLALAGALWWLLVVAMIDWHLGMLENDDGRALRRLGLPNLLTAARAGIVPVLTVASPALLAALVISAGGTDVIDGRLARARAEQTRLGAWLDPSVDALLLSAAAIGAARLSLLPWWGAALVAGRHALQWLGVAAVYFVRAAPPGRRGFVPGKAPGLALFAGLSLAALGLRAALPLVVSGAIGGLVTFGLTVVRSYQIDARTRTEVAGFKVDRVSSSARAWH
jgi:phosphatidylglycerophosphate synthase